MLTFDHYKSGNFFASPYSLSMRRLSRDREITNHPYSYREFLRFLWRAMRGHRGRFWAATFFRVSGDAVWLYPAYALATIVTVLSNPITDQSYRTIVMVAVIWGLATVWRLAAQNLSKNIGNKLAERLGLDTYQAAMDHMYRLDMHWHENENAGNKLKRIDRGAQSINRILRLWYGMMIEIGVNLIGMIFIISRITPGLGASLLVFVVVFLWLSTLLMRRIALIENTVDQKEEDVQGLAFEGVNNIRTVKALGMADSFSQRLKKEIAELLENIGHRIIAYQRRSTILNTWGQFFRYSSIFFIVYGVLNGHYELGFLVLFQSYFNRLWESVGELSEMAPDVVTAKYAVGRMEYILREPVRIESTDGKQQFPADWKELVVQGMSFSYGQEEVLHDLSFTIRRGERIGIVGLSGAGKSTLFKLLMKEHENYQGQIAFDGAPLMSIDKPSYLRHLAVVLQDTEVFNFTLRENIQIASTSGDEEALSQALETAHVNDFLHKLPSGLDTIIGEKGFRLSGGEKQRLGIARAIYKRPQILLLDEATSHLDLESEKKIQDSLHRFFQSVTAIVIAHRLTTIKEMDRIIVIEDGRIIESGSFQELQTRRGRFFELWERQRL